MTAPSMVTVRAAGLVRGDVVSAGRAVRTVDVVFTTWGAVGVLWVDGSYSRFAADDTVEVAR